MKISVLTHNLLFHRAFADIEHLLKTYKPDIACFQEVETDEEDFVSLEKIGYKLADFSNSFIKIGKVFCVATFYKKETFEILQSQSITLPRTYYEIFWFLVRGAHNPRTVLKTDFLSRNTQQKLTMYNVHLSVFTTNGGRVKQIMKTLTDVSDTSDDHVIVAGDFNYPYGRRRFESLIKTYGLAEATSNIYHTFERRVLGLFSLKLKDDYILYKNLKAIETKKVEKHFSDHYPILTTFEL